MKTIILTLMCLTALNGLAYTNAEKIQKLKQFDPGSYEMALSDCTVWAADYGIEPENKADYIDACIQPVAW